MSLIREESLKAMGNEANDGALQGLNINLGDETLANIVQLRSRFCREGPAGLRWRASPIMSQEHLGKAQSAGFIELLYQCEKLVLLAI